MTNDKIPTPTHYYMGTPLGNVSREDLEQAFVTSQEHIRETMQALTKERIEHIRTMAQLAVLQRRSLLGHILARFTGG